MKGEIIMTEKLTNYQKEIIEGNNFIKKRTVGIKEK